jgi:hypothetical protein
MGLANHDLPPPPSGKYPAKAHARRVADFIAENGGPKDGVIYLEAQKTAMIEVWWILLSSLSKWSLMNGQNFRGWRAERMDDFEALLITDGIRMMIKLHISGE